MNRFAGYLLTISLLFISTGVVAQKADTISLKKAVVELNEALIKRDTMRLKKLLDDQVLYGHSNGWAQTKQDVISDLYNGKLTYTSIDQETERIGIDKDAALVGAVANVSVVMDGNPIQIKLRVMQVWTWRNGWKLFGRQSVKIK